MQKRPPRRRDIIIIAVIISIVLYVAGVITGLNANKILEKQVDVEINDIKAVIYNSTLDLKNLELQQFYVNNFPTKDKCEFTKIYMDHLYNYLRTYWAVLPSRIEAYDKEYDRNSREADDYIALKREYIRLSLRFWLTSVNYRQQCNDETIVPILYFYSPSCDTCVEQGESFDDFRLLNQDKDILIFPIDGEFPDDTTYMLKQFYNITTYPAMIIKGNIIQGRIVTAQELNLHYG